MHNRDYLPRSYAACTAVLGALAVVAGAFGAHALRDRIDPRLFDAFEKGVFYHLIHVLVLLFLLSAERASLLSNRDARNAFHGFLIGIGLFSGSLYLLALTGLRPLGMITPFGGTAFIITWAFLARAFMRSETSR